jgi:hypothetical protein
VRVPLRVATLSADHFCRLIVVACLVEMGEVVARLVVHATSGKNSAGELAAAVAQMPVDREHVLRVLDGMVSASKR